LSKSSTSNHNSKAKTSRHQAPQNIV